MAATLVFNNPLLVEKIAEHMAMQNLMQFSVVNRNTDSVTKDYRYDLKSITKDYILQKYEALVKEYMIWWAEINNEPFIFYFVIDKGYSILDKIEDLILKNEFLMNEICGCSAFDVVTKNRNDLDDYYTTRISDDHPYI
tara:strand:+ start:434 stop:850 length:417 start_codon:yes stop_codon:yes gene_type:complete